MTGKEIVYASSPYCGCTACLSKLGYKTIKERNMLWKYLISERKSQKIGTKKQNPWGFHDMLGNVWEWCLQ